MKSFVIFAILQLSAAVKNQLLRPKSFNPVPERQKAVSKAKLAKARAKAKTKAKPYP